jgi:mRNA export factor
MSFGMPTQGSMGGVPNPNRDFQVANPPADGVSSLSWSPSANFLVATCWAYGEQADNVLCYEVQTNGQAMPKAAIKHEAPVLCSAWHSDGSAVFSGGCDNQVKKWDLATNQTTQVAQHDAPVRHCAWINEVNLLVTGSWDKTLKYWDTRQPNPALRVQLPERCYALSVTHPLLVVGTAERHIQVYNLSDPSRPYKQLMSPLKYQTRTVAAFPNKQGYLVGSIEGRVAVNHVEESLASKNFTFKCHREQADIYAVNDVKFHPRHGTFVTCGSDGVFNFWDKDSKQRLKQMAKCSAPIPCGDFNRDGSIFAYAVSYDWSKGGSDPMASMGQDAIFLHAVADAEVLPRPQQSRTGGRR